MSVEGVGPATFWKLVNRFGSAEAVWNAGKEEFLNSGLGLKDGVVASLEARKKTFCREVYIEAMEKNASYPLFIKTGGYPERVGELSSPPPIIWARGRTEWLNSYPQAAVVGARNSNVYGREVTEQFVYDLVCSGVTIVSGLAYGIDSCAHKVALDTPGGQTIGVLGGGMVPQLLSRHDEIFVRMADEAVLISQFDPFAHAGLSTFPQRNKIMAALSDAVVVTQAGRDSGALNTAMHANKLERHVYVVPGDIDNERSVGCNALIANDKAKLVVSSNKILQALFPFGGFGGGCKENAKAVGDAKTLDSTDLKSRVYKLLSRKSAKSVDQLVLQTNEGVSEVLSALGELELLGQIRSVGGKYLRV